jgi:hypothetical protein
VTPSTYSTARIDSLICPVLVDAKDLRSCLPDHAGLSLPRLPHVPEGQHPVIVEVWRVQDGVIDVGGATAHRMWELAGGATGLGFGGSAGAALGAGLGGVTGAAGGGAFGMWLGPLGWWSGAVAGAAAGAAMGAALTGITGAMQGARWAALAGRRTSETASRVIGTYNEIIVTVPCRFVGRGGYGGDFAFVLATYTDSTASMLGERLIGWGYRKSPAFGTRSGGGVLEVNIGPSAEPVRIVSHPQPAGQIEAYSAAAHVLAALSNPLLGGLSADQLIVSYLNRSFGSSGVQLAPAAVRLEAGDAFLPGLRGLSANIPCSGAANPWGAFSVTGMQVTLSYPRYADALCA